MFDTIAIIGLGLIGGSIARKVKEISPGTKILVYNRTQSVADAAIADGNADVRLPGIGEKLREADLVLLCTPVTLIAEYMNRIKPYLKSTAILSDVGSTKTSICDTAVKCGLEEYFIGGHPMAGSERTGYANSRANLLENAYYILTPTGKNRPGDVEKMVSFVRSLTALPLVLDPKEHDRAVAAISHVPHLIASSLVCLVEDSDSPEQVMKKIAAGGFKDITRIASSSPVMWEQICMENRDNILPLLRKYIADLSDMADHIEAGDGAYVHDRFVKSGAYRSSIDDRGNRTGNPEYALFCDLPDRPGAIAVIATLLSFEEISIKNVGINHNRELQEGSVKIEFHDPVSCGKAAAILTAHHFPVYSRKP
ncbi:MAG: prephenate dehydrogenase/arogenate dehydrogenase family protein [Lachnospiraceae bacterium]|jgi:prephenate dehydrogenase